MDPGPIPDELRLKLEADTARRAACRKDVDATARPWDELPDECDPAQHANSEVMFYGIGVMHHELVAYAWKKCLFPPGTDLLEPGIMPAAAVAAACLKVLRTKFQLPKLMIRIPVSTKYDWVVVLYSNYNPQPELLETDGADLLRRVANELGIEVTRPVQWHFDPMDPDKEDIRARLAGSTTRK